MERFDKRPSLDELDEWPITGEIPGGPIPSLTNHNGYEPTTPEELEEITRALNNGHHPEVAKELGIVRILFRDGRGWKILAGSAAAVGTGIGLFEITKELLKHHKANK